ncbi:glutathione S-transferase 1 [Lepeophtheirus salmonis]|uniref:Glutathione Stransferase 11like [Musca domestica] n=1 Tax=Lepeophtheirus salmonis TaxID=72036 RepID=A0A0K2VKJ7_LEPSM|nr:glutathione S-transferase 1-like [Lepeophtheirus salmonis]XP_040568945.1 glutathione S-transferase 1-like [Lepeophtheirus salmonis]XP_040568946.1 glutathione S-transferase 1-like [Lepeophtheirus salmonis]
MSAIEIYGIESSPPCRIAFMTAEVTGISYEVKEINLRIGDHMKPEFLALNPQHSVPVLKHGDFVMNESRAIASYIAIQFDKSKKLYPFESKVLARVNQRLYFDSCVFYKSFAEVVYPKIFGKEEVKPEAMKKLKEVLGWANDMVKETGYAAGTDHLTIADIAWISTYSTIKAADVVCLSEYKELENWFAQCIVAIPNYNKANGKGAKACGDYYKSMF